MLPAKTAIGQYIYYLATRGAHRYERRKQKVDKEEHKHGNEENLIRGREGGCKN